MDKSTHEKLLPQLLQTKNNHFRIAIAFLTGYHGIIKVTNSTTIIFREINY